MSIETNIPILPGSGPAGPEFVPPAQFTEQSDEDQLGSLESVEEVDKNENYKRYRLQLMRAAGGGMKIIAGAGLSILSLSEVFSHADATPQEQLSRLMAAAAGALIFKESLQGYSTSLTEMEKLRPSLEDETDPGITKER